MFLTAELRRTVSREDYAEKAPALRSDLLEAQLELRRASFPVIIVFGGVDGAGKSETINLLHEWLDPRWLITRAYGETTEEEAQRPEFWRYWRDLPPRGRIGLYLSAWYSQPILNRVFDRSDDAAFDESLDRIMAFEKALADDGALIVKFWMHLGRDAQKERFRQLEKSERTAWRVSKADWDHWKRYDRFITAAERAITRTSRGRVPWHIVEGFDERYRNLSVAGTLLDRMRTHLSEEVLRAEFARQRLELPGANRLVRSGETHPAADSVPEFSYNPVPEISILSRLDMSQELDKKAYRRKLEQYQGMLNLLTREVRQRGISTILVFEGWDAAGKGGAIRRLMAGLDARLMQVIPIMAPTEEENDHHYLWRFWRHLPSSGRVTIFDRSWYGRLLVERVEGLAEEFAWKRAYAEINDFEDQLVSSGVVLCKFWLHITRDEQLGRFQQREKLPHKQWKLTPDDWRNREKWDAYETAVDEMIERTGTSRARWTLVEANDKRFARIKIFRTVCEALETALKRDKPAS